MRCNFNCASPTRQTQHVYTPSHSATPQHAQPLLLHSQDTSMAFGNSTNTSRHARMHTFPPADTTLPVHLVCLVSVFSPHGTFEVVARCQVNRHLLEQQPENVVMLTAADGYMVYSHAYGFSGRHIYVHVAPQWTLVQQFRLLLAGRDHSFC